MGEPQSFHDNLFEDFCYLLPVCGKNTVWKRLTICPHRYIHRMSNYNNLICSHGVIIIGDFDTLEKKVIDLKDSTMPETFDLVEN
jgi:hypothetical protein